MDPVELSLLQRNGPTHPPAKDVPFLFRKRYFVVFMVFWGMVIINVLGVNFSIVMVDMTTAKNVTIEDKIVVKEPEFQWTQFEIGLLLSCHASMFVFGFAGGLLSKKLGGTRIFGLAAFLNGAFSFFSPFVLKFSLLLFFIVRMCEGLFHIIAFGSFLQILMKWAPTGERFRMTNVSFSGVFVGIIMTFPICGMILEKLGWQYVFFFTGGASTLWYIIWVILVYDDPLTDKFISHDEKYFIIENVEILPTKVVYPWRKILTSKAVWAYLNERLVQSWSVAFVIQYLPLYIKDSFNVTISQLGFITSAPHLFNFVGMLIGGQIADTLRNWNILPPPKVYTVLITISQLTCVISLLVMGMWANFVGTMVCICLLRFMYGIAESAYLVLPMDIVGEYASLVHGLGFSVFSVGAVLNPIIMSLVVPNQSPDEWCHYFLLLSVFNVWGCVIFYFYGSGQPEPWVVAEKRNQSQRDNEI